MVTIEDIRHAAGGGDWSLGVVERVLRMAQLLAACASHPALRDRIALKGGTALNMFDHDQPRLSVDLDFNLVGITDPDELQAARDAVSAALAVVAHRLALTAREAKASHAGAAWRMTYQGVIGSGVIEVDLNFLHRVPLLATRRVSVRALDTIDVADALALAPQEVAAGKLLALLDRTHPRDVWDCDLIARAGGIDDPALRACFIAYLAGARRPWRELLGAQVAIDPAEAERLLVPMLGSDQRPEHVESWAAAMTERVERAIAPLRVPTDPEVAFLDAVAERGEVDPALLGLDPADPMHAAIVASPPLAWKARNVRKRG